MPKEIISIVQQFPEFEERIDFLMQVDENFRDLCKDYILCTSMVLKRKKENNKIVEETEELEELQREMEKEILHEIMRESK